MSKTFTDLLPMERDELIYNALQEISGHTSERPMNAEEILSIKDRHKRLQMINENIEIFSRERNKSDQELAQEAVNWHYLKKYGVTPDNVNDLTVDEILDRVPAGIARVQALKHAKRG